MIRSHKGYIIKNEDGSERVNYDVEGFPSYCYNGWIEPRSRWGNVPHFHEDVEICAVREGTTGYCVNGRNYVLHEGDTIFINSGAVHYSMALQETRAYYTIVVIHPSLLCSSLAVERKFVLPVTENSDIDCIVFRSDCKYGKKMFRDTINMHKCLYDEFATTKNFFAMWENILKSCDDLFGFSEVASRVDPHLDSLKSMLSFIRTNYDRKISLDDIAAVGNVSRTLCNKLFNTYTSRSPIEELMRYRCQKACEMLTSGKSSLSQVASSTGFSSANYLSDVFRKTYGLSPREYRKKFTADV